MKRIFGFGSYSANFICNGIFITSILIIFRFIYFSRFGISIESTGVEVLTYTILNYYIRFFEPIVILIWIKFVCEFLYSLLKSE